MSKAFQIEKNKEDVIRSCIKQNKSVLLVGETGTGKTTIIREIGKEMSKVLHRVSLNGTTSIEDIVGKWLVKAGSTVWQDGILTMAMRKGDWVVFDEINAALPEILFALQSVLDDARCLTLVEKDGEIVPSHEEFRFFATMNPTEDYAGTKELNKALVSRFAAIIEVVPPPPEIELEILVGLHKVDASIAGKLIVLANGMRQSKAKDEIMYFCSTRDLIQTGHLAAHVGLDDAIRFCIMSKMTKDEIAGTKEVLHLVKKLPVIDLAAIMKSELNSTKTINDLKEKLTHYEGVFSAIKKL